MTDVNKKGYRFHILSNTSKFWNIPETAHHMMFGFSESAWTSEDVEEKWEYEESWGGKEAGSGGVRSGVGVGRGVAYRVEGGSRRSCFWRVPPAVVSFRA